MNEVDLKPVDLGLELRQRIQPRLARAPIVVFRPIARERLKRGELHTLRPIGDQLLAGPAGGVDAAAKVCERLVREADLEGANIGMRHDRWWWGHAGFGRDA